MTLPGTASESLLVHVERRSLRRARVRQRPRGARAGAGAGRAAGAGALDRCARGRFPAGVPSNVEVVATDVPEAELRAAPDGAFVLVMTHSHDLDFALVDRARARRLALRRPDRLGVQARPVRARLHRARLPAERLARVTCPVGAGLPGVDRSKEPGSHRHRASPRSSLPRKAARATSAQRPFRRNYALMPPASTDAAAPLRLSLRGITKRYPTVVANDGIDLDGAARRDPRRAGRERRRQVDADEDHLRRRQARRRHDRVGRHSRSPSPIRRGRGGSASAWCSSTSRCSRR